VTREKTLEDVQEIVREVLDDDTVQLAFGTTASDVKSWDSLAHVRIMVAVEKHFQIRFEVDELNSFENVGQLVDGIAARKAG
jgi:acyl carrier protein